MNVESLLPFLIVLGVLFMAFLLEALVLFFFRLKNFWAAIALSVLINLVSFTGLYFVASPFLGWLGYQVTSFSSLNPPIQVAAFLWWFSTIIEGLLLLYFVKLQNASKIFLASITMNWLSFMFLFAVIFFSH